MKTTKMATKTALVTGANRGIGFEVAKALLQQPDYRVILGCRDPKSGNDAVSKLQGEVIAMELDLNAQSSIDRCISKILDETGGIDVLVNNAGVLHSGSILETTVEHMTESFQVHTFAPIHLIKAFLPGMIDRNYGRIVNVSSGWGAFDEGLSGPFAYSVSKAALNAVTLATAGNLPENVKINSVCPGWVRTRMGGMMATRSTKEGADSIVWLATLPSTGPSGGFFRDQKRIEW